MPRFIKVATTDELREQQSKLVELEGQKIALFVQILEMLSDDPGSEPDMKSWARKTANELLEITQDGAVYRFLVRKAR